MSWNSFRNRLDRLPFILAGPVLRHTSTKAVTVWLALQKPCNVTLNVYETQADGQTIGRLIITGTHQTVALGQYLHIVAVTAKAENEELRSPQIYAYDLNFESEQLEPQTLQQASTSRDFPTVSLSYFPHQLPTFVLPPEDLNDLRLVHGSCRKPHGKGYDALPILDCLLEQNATAPNFRPQQLFLTGDQIYGDDVADPLLWILTEVGDTLLGWEESLPLLGSDRTTAKQLKPGQRSQIAEKEAGFTAGLKNKAEYAKSHLLSLGEYYGIYLLSLSPVFWSQPFPEGHEIYREKKQAKRWDEEVEDLGNFARTLSKVQRAVANISTYTIFDDHDVSDDWYLNQAWCMRVLGKPLGRRVVQNALLAYAVFQAWGNTPGQFQEGAGAKLLAAAHNWSSSAGTDSQAEDAIARYLGLPPSDPLTKLPQMRLDEDVLILDRSPDALQWHYTIKNAAYEVIVLDTRTWRGYPANKEAIAPPRLLSPTAFEQQLETTLRQHDSSQMKATLIVAPTNTFSLEAIEWVQQWKLRNRQVFDSDVGDAWNINTSALAQLLSTVFEEREQVIVLSGDIHYSSALRLDFWSEDNKPRIFAQLTASAIKNRERSTQVAHTKAKSILLPERSRYWIGSAQPPQMQEVKSLPKVSHPWSNWACRLQWIPRQPAQSPPWGKSLPWLNLKPKSKGILSRLSHLIGLLWRNRWVQEGREIVGLNNLGLIQFDWSDDFERRWVTQDTYWYASWGKLRIVFSRFKVWLGSKK
jgi:PhoD-like phosphatase